MLKKLEMEDGTIRYERHINAHKLAELLNSLPQTNMVLTNIVGNLIIYEPENIVGYIDIGNEDIKTFD